MSGLEVELELTEGAAAGPGWNTALHRGLKEGCVAAGSLRAASSLRRGTFPPGRLPVFRLPPFPRNLSPARLDPGSPVGGKAPAFFLLYSFTQAGLPAFSRLFLRSGSHPFPSLAQAPYPSPLAEFQHPGDFP